MSDDTVVAMTVRFPSRILDAMRKQAASEERPLNTTIVRALRAYLEAAKESSKKGR